MINNDIKKKAEQNEADIFKYKLEKVCEDYLYYGVYISIFQEAEANNALYTDKYIQLNLAKSLSNNTKFYFSGQKSELGGIFNKILGN